MEKKLAKLVLPDFPGEKERLSILRTLKALVGVEAVRVDQASRRILVIYDSRCVDTFGLAEAVSAAGFQLPVETYLLYIGGMTCAACAFHVESALTDVPGVKAAEVNLTSNCATIEVILTTVQPAAWQQALATAGYQMVSPAVRLQ